MTVNLFSMIFFLVLQIGVCQNLMDQRQKPVSLFSKKNLSSYLNVLGNDSLEGRGTGSIGEIKAAEFLSSRFSEIGLVPIGEDNSYFQSIPLHGSKPLPESELKIYHDKESLLLNLNEDYLLFTSGEQTFVPLPAPLVFVGYGIIAPEYDYNDYQSMGVEGKIVVFVDGEPISNDEDYFAGESPTPYSFPDAKQRIALARGAVGSILIPIIENYSERRWTKTINEFSFEHVSLASTVNKNLSILFNPAKSSVLFKSAMFSLDDISGMHYENKMQSFDLNCTASFNGVFEERDFLSANIVGMIEGSDPKLKDTYILISAHYDHLGIGTAVSGDSIYNGVLDNAIGAAGLLEIARVFKLSNTNLKRSIIFLLTAAEEKGLLGSIHYTLSPLKPLYKTIANVNIDGMAYLDEFNSVIGIGAEYSSLDKYFEQTLSLLNLKGGDIPLQFERWKSFYQSDQIAFASAGIPSIIIYEAIDFKNLSKETATEIFIKYSTNIYHSPFDDLSQEINYSASIQHLHFIYNFVTLLANSETEPIWNDDSPFMLARLRSIAERR